MRRLLHLLPLFAAGALAAHAAPTTTPLSTGGDSPAPDLAAALARAGQYVLEYEQRFHDIVAKEAYDQTGPRDRRRQVGGLPLRCGVSFCRRTTRADIVFVRLSGDIPWGTFRDVYEVDGERVRDHEARIERLFRDTPQAAAERARSLLAESAKYNIGPAARTLNFPTLPLPCLVEQHERRFAWKRRGEQRVAGVRGLELEFDETARPTFVRDGDNGEQLPARGRFSIDPERGTVMRSEVCFRWEPERAEACLVTDYRPEPSLAMWVPTEMRERYGDLPYGSTRVFGATSEATARYSGYRRFTVTIQEENVTPQPKP